MKLLLNSFHVNVHDALGFYPDLKLEPLYAAS